MIFESEHLGAPERGGAEAFQNSVAALESGLDAEVDHRGSHYRESEDPGGEEIDGV